MPAQLESLGVASGDVKWYSCYKNSTILKKNFKVELLYDPGIPLLPKVLSVGTHTDIGAPMS